MPRKKVKPFHEQLMDVLPDHTNEEKIKFPRADTSSELRPKRKSWSTVSTIVQWVVVAGLATWLWWIWFSWHIPNLRASIPIPGYQTEFYALCMAFTFVNGRYWATKPMSCLKCMTAWISLALGCYEYGCGGIIFLPIGFMVGAIVDRLMMRL